MNIYYAIKGPKKGKFFDWTEDGLEELTIQKQNGKEVPAGYTGLIIPFSAMQEDVIKYPRKGQPVDERLYAHLRR